ncbi:MAG: signal peptidase I [Thermodesulfobacteriota bacterium]
MEQAKRRRPFVAGLLSFLVPGLGQVYNGRLRKGFLFFLVGCVLDIVPSAWGWAADFRGFVLTILVLPTVFRIVAAAEAFWQARRVREIKLRSYDRWYVYVSAIVVALGLGFLGASVLGTGGLEFGRIPAASMLPTLEVGDYYMMDTGSYLNRQPGRGDIVVFEAPGARPKDFIKRVIGLPGERIEIKDKVVFINDTRLEEPYVIHLHEASFPAQAITRDNMGPAVIPEEHVFVMGDNRDYSHDSRFFGPVPWESIAGKALYIFWAKDRSRIGTRLD